MALTDRLVAIADAIRAKTGRPDKLTLDDMPLEIEMIQSGGGDDGSLKAVIERTATNPTLPSDLTSIGTYAFYGCTGLALTSLPSGVTSIGTYAFYYCTGLALTSLPSGVTSIGNYAFSGCGRLALTSLPSGVTSIGNNAFQSCTGLKSLTFEGKPNSIKSSAFSSCTNLLTINVPWAEGEVANAPWGATKATINYNYTGG
jgi:hypothetical protein